MFSQIDTNFPHLLIWSNVIYTELKQWLISSCLDFALLVFNLVDRAYLKTCDYDILSSLNLQFLIQNIKNFSKLLFSFPFII